MMYVFEDAATTLEKLLVDNEYIKECYKNCEMRILNKEGEIDVTISKCDILLTDLRLLFIENSVYFSENSKTPVKFDSCRFIYISNIIVNAISTPIADSDEKTGNDTYLYIQLGGETNQDGDNFELAEINILCNSHENQNIIYSMFNIISEIVAYNEQVENLEKESLSTEGLISDEHIDSN